MFRPDVTDVREMLYAREMASREPEPQARIFSAIEGAEGPATIFIRVQRHRNWSCLTVMKLSNNTNSQKRRYNHVFNHLKNIKAEILNTTVLDNRLLSV